jgi:hypothetical protein
MAEVASKIRFFFIWEQYSTGPWMKEKILEYHWGHYREARSYIGSIQIRDEWKRDASFVLSGEAGQGETIHVICGVKDTGTPPLTRYQRVVV